MKTNKRPLIKRYKFTIINPTKTVFTLVLEPNTVTSGNPTTRDFNLDMNKASFNLFMVDGNLEQYFSFEPTDYLALKKEN